MTADPSGAGDRSAPRRVPFDSRRLAVDDHHTLYVEQVGNPQGVPVVFLHGGPGSGCQESHRDLFDPRRFRAVLFDQRGAGRSTPRLSLVDNTTWHLVADVERIRKALGIDRWMVVGGSWGALLALAYAQAHPERVAAMVLRAVFLGRKHDVEWAWKEGPKTFYPELWQAVVNFLPLEDRADALAAFRARVLDQDPALRDPAAWVWHDYERALSVLRPGSLDLASATGRRGVPGSPILEWHYAVHDFFLKPDAILDGIGRLAEIPAVIVQGRYDLLCPPALAYDLAERWPSAAWKIAEGSGHSQSEPEIARLVVAAIDELGGRIAYPQT